MHPTPRHFWPIVTIAFLWHLVGCLDYMATQYEWQSWMQMFSQRQEKWIETMPDWVNGTWAIVVWAGLLGAILMASRARFAPLVLFVSAAAMLVLTVWALVWSRPDLTAIAADMALWTLFGSCVVTLFLWLYARAMNRAGVIG